MFTSRNLRSNITIDLKSDFRNESWKTLPGLHNFPRGVWFAQVVAYYILARFARLCSTANEKKMGINEKYTRQKQTRAFQRNLKSNSTRVANYYHRCKQRNCTQVRAFFPNERVLQKNLIRKKLTADNIGHVVTFNYFFLIRRIDFICVGIDSFLRSSFSGN